MKTDGIIAFKQYVEALGKAHSIREYMEEGTGIQVIGIYPEIHVDGIYTLRMLAKEYKRNIIYAETDRKTCFYKYRASFQIHSKEHGIQFTVFCHTDEGEAS